MFCMKCGTQLPDTARFCCKCGTAMNAPAPSKPVSQETVVTGNTNSTVHAVPRPAASAQYTTKTQESRGGIEKPACMIRVDQLKLSLNAKKINPFKFYDGATVTFDGKEIRIEALFMTTVHLQLEDIVQVSMHHAMMNCNGLSIEVKHGDGYYLYTGFGEFGYKARLEKLELMIGEINKRLS